MERRVTCEGVSEYIFTVALSCRICPITYLATSYAIAILSHIYLYFSIFISSSRKELLFFLSFRPLFFSSSLC